MRDFDFSKAFYERGNFLSAELPPLVRLSFDSPVFNVWTRRVRHLAAANVTFIFLVLLYYIVQHFEICYVLLFIGVA